MNRRLRSRLSTAGMRPRLILRLSLSLLPDPTD
jgi:hypothetical protein